MEDAPCRNCGETFPRDPDADYCPTCAAENAGDDDAESTRVVWQQMTTGKIHRRERCGINRRTRYLHARREMNETELAAADLCGKCWR